MIDGDDGVGGICAVMVKDDVSLTALSSRRTESTPSASSTDEDETEDAWICASINTNRPCREFVWSTCCSDKFQC